MREPLVPDHGTIAESEFKERGRDNRGRKSPRRRETPMDPEMMAVSAGRAENLVRGWLDSMGFTGDFQLAVEENAQQVFVESIANETK